MPKNKQRTLVEDLVKEENKEENKELDKTLSLGALELDEGILSNSQQQIERTFGYSEKKTSSELSNKIIKGKYKILDLLGEGGGSKVYLTERLLIQDKTALKILFSELANDPIKVKRFHLEAVTTASIKHPNVIAIYDFDYTEQNIPFIVMELLQGQTLLTRIKQKKQLNLSECVAIITPICAALNVAHSRGIVHRDLKPGNIVLHKMDDGSEVVKVIDFGIAKSLLNGNRINTGPGIVFGTPSYMSPEHCLGEKVIDGRSDVYSLGVLLFEMLTGKLPFYSGSPTSIMFRHIRETPPSPKAICPDIDPKIEELILRSLAKEPNRRFPSTLDLAAELNKILLEKNLTQ